jgi:hypothetical protein
MEYPCLKEQKGGNDPKDRQKPCRRRCKKFHVTCLLYFAVHAFRRATATSPTADVDTARAVVR